MRYENDPLVGLYVGSCHSSIARSLTVQQMSHRAPGVFELAHTKPSAVRTVFRAGGWQAPYRRWLSSFSFALARARRESPSFGICVVLLVPHPLGTCHALGALLVLWPAGSKELIGGKNALVLLLTSRWEGQFCTRCLCAMALRRAKLS